MTNTEWLIIGSELLPVEGSLVETLNKHKSKLKKTGRCFNTITAGNQPPHLEVARVFKERYGHKLPLPGWTPDWAFEAIDGIAREHGVRPYEDGSLVPFADTVIRLIKPR
jgi:hypothetical protein